MSQCRNETNFVGALRSPSRLERSRRPSSVTAEPAQRRARPLGKQLPRHDVGVVLHLGDQHLAPGPSSNAVIVCAAENAWATRLIASVAFFVKTTSSRDGPPDEGRHGGPGPLVRLRRLGPQPAASRGPRWRCAAGGSGGTPRSRLRGFWVVVAGVEVGQRVGVDPRPGRSGSPRRTTSRVGGGVYRRGSGPACRGDLRAASGHLTLRRNIRTGDCRRGTLLVPLVLELVGELRTPLFHDLAVDEDVDEVRRMYRRIRV